MTWKRIIFIGLAMVIFPGICCAAQTLTADKAVQIAVQNNLDRKLAAEEVQITADRVNQAIAAFGPRVTLGAGGYRYDEQPSLVQLKQGIVRLNNALSALSAGRVPPLEEPDSGRTYYGYTFELTQPLYTGNRLTAMKHMAEAGHENARQDLGTAENDLTLAVKKAYYTVVLCRQLSRTMDEAVASMGKHVAEAEEYHRQDTVPKLDVLRARERLADLTQQQLYAHNNFALSKTNLNYVLGVDMDMDYTLPESMPSLRANPDLATCEKEALSRRPELAAIEAKIDMATEAVRLAKSAHYPSIALVGGYHHYEPENDEPSAQIGLVAQIKLWDQGLTRHRVAEARDTLSKARTGKKQLTRGIRLQVKQAFSNTQVAKQAIDVAEHSLATAEETLRAAKTRYKVGLSTSLERLDAEVGLTQAKTNHIRALSSYNIARAELARAMGETIALQHETTR